MPSLSHVLRVTAGFLILIACLAVGEGVKTLLGWIVPGNVLGLLLLLGLLSAGWVSLSWIEDAAHLLLRLMPLLFVPLVVIVGDRKDLWSTGGWILPIAILAAVALQWWAVGRGAQWLLRRAAPPDSGPSDTSRDPS